MVRIAPPRSGASPLVWFAVAGPAVAWGIQFTAGYWISEGHCNPATGGWTGAGEAWVVALTVIAALVAVGAGLVALALYRGTSDAEEDDAPPAGRTHFMAVIGMAITPLFTFMIVMNGVGVGVLSPCHTS
jgi:hypothetical protein